MPGTIEMMVRGVPFDTACINGFQSLQEPHKRPARLIGMGEPSGVAPDAATYHRGLFLSRQQNLEHFTRERKRISGAEGIFCSVTTS